MQRFGRFLRRHPLWVGFGATLVPLLVLLGLQYRWLARLERMTAQTHQAALDNALEAIGSEVEYFYRSNAERALSLPAWFLTEDRVEDVAVLWGKHPPPGARVLFLVDYTQEEFGKYWRFDATQNRMVPLEANGTGLAVILAAAPWQLFRARGARMQRATLDIDERDPDNRIILNPITDSGGWVLGLAGMVVDETYVRQELLPEAIDETLAKFFPEAPRNDLKVGVRDAGGTGILERGTLLQGDRVKRRLPFVFTDWTLELYSAPSGPERWARASFLFNMTLGVLLALVLAGGVVLALRAANRAMRLSGMKSDFVSNVSHELRTPLASIRVFAEFLRLGRAQSDSKVREYGEYIEAESQRLTRLIDNILDFSRIESGRKTYRYSEGDIRQVVESVVHTFDIRLQHSGFRVRLQAPKAPPPPLRMDADAMGQALHNLLDNAVKYSGAQRDIDLDLQYDDSEIVIAVRDHGIGIADDEQRKIFDRFHRVGGVLVHDVKGTGLGLSIVQHIVQAHDGHITVESEPNRGSTFRIQLPVAASGPASAGPRDAGTAQVSVEKPT